MEGNKIADDVENGKATEKDLLQLDTPIFNSLTNAEKQMAFAILTYRNGDNPPTRESYLEDLRHKGLKDGSYIAINQSPYFFMNRQEDRRNYKGSDSGNVISGIIEAGKRMYHDPNRGRLGSWKYRIKPDGTIEISDAFSGTDKNAARDIFFRGTTHELKGKITPEQQQKWLKRTY